MKYASITLVFALAAFSFPALAETPAPAKAADSAMHLPAENAGEAQLRAQLEQVRALNAQLRQERQQLEEQLATIQAEVAAENKRLKQVVVEGERLSENAAPGINLWLLAGGMIAVAALLAFGFWYLHRLRNAVGKA